MREWLKRGCVAVNQRVTTRFDCALKAGDEIAVDSAGARAVTPAARFHIQIIYEDDVLVAIHKPAGLLSIGTDKIQRETALFAVNDYLNKKAALGKPGRARICKRVFIVHRLDRGVSGLMLFAKNEAVKFRLQKRWGQFAKEYWAVVEGKPPKPAGTCVSYLVENQILRVASGPKRPGAKEAVTHYKVIRSGKDYSLLTVKLGTGRKHQIRVHLADLGCPVAGDEMYGAQTNPLGRIALHAGYLKFFHPVTGKPIFLTCPAPDSFKRLAAQN